MEIVKTGGKRKARESRREGISPEPRTEIFKLSRRLHTPRTSVV